MPIDKIKQPVPHKIKKNSDWFLGIDPGAKGAMCRKRGSEIEIFDYAGPVETAAELRKWLRKCEIAGAFLELVGVMPTDGKVSAFKFGTNFGEWRGMLCALEIPVKLISPQSWRKGLFKKSDGTTTKKKSLAVARRMFPGNDLFRLEKNHDRAEAMLMALQAERYFFKRGRIT